MDLIEQINNLVSVMKTEEEKAMHTGMGFAMQQFGADVNEDGMVEGQRGFRVITHTTELDSQGTEENESELSDFDLLHDAMMEAQANQPGVIQRAQTSAAVRQDLHDKEMELVRLGMESSNLLGDIDNRAGMFQSYAQEEINDQIEELRALNKGCLIDITDKDLHANFVEREIEPWSPEMLGFKFDNPEFSRFHDEVEPERIPFVRVKLEDRNWPHLMVMDQKRVERFTWLKVHIRQAFNNARLMRKTAHANRAKHAFSIMKWKINEARDYSFAGKLLNSLAPSMEKNAWWQKRNFYLKLDLQKLIRNGGKKFSPEQHLKMKDQRIYNVYNESRGLTFAQHTELMDGWNKMNTILNPEGKKK